VFHPALGPPRTVLQVFELVVRAAAITKLAPRTLVLDGEVALFDQQLRSWFEWLREPDPDAVATPPLLMAFDILYRDWPRTHRAAAP
jgi:ATP-dependent DNA ligase